MSLWCLRHVDYDALNFLKHPELTFQECELHEQPESSLLQEHVKSSGKNSVSTECRNFCRYKRFLRNAILHRDRQKTIPYLIKNCPLNILRLSDIVIPEECDRNFDNQDELWTYFLQSLLNLPKHCKLTCLDFSGFVPSRNMLTTMLQLLPFLSLPPEHQTAEYVYNLLHSAAKVQNYESLLPVIKEHLEQVFRHRIFKMGKSLMIPQKTLQIVFDFIPLSSKKLSYLKLLTAVLLRDVTPVQVSLKSFVFKYEESNDKILSTHPLMPLQFTLEFIPLLQWRITGVAIENVPSKEMNEVLLRHLQQSFLSLNSLQTLALRYCFLTDAAARELFRSISGHHAINRLDLSGTSLNGVLSDILRHLNNPLNYLNISDCSLEVGDVDALFSQEFSAGVGELDLSFVYSSSCDECKDRHSRSGMQSFRKLRNIGSSIDSDSSMTQHSCSENQVTIEDVSFWTMWNLLIRPDNEPNPDHKSSSGSSTTCKYHQSHSKDCQIIEVISSRLSLLKRICVLSINNNCFTFRIPDVILKNVLDAVIQLDRLKHLSMEELPMWNDDILLFVESLCKTDSGLQSLALSRSTEAPRMKNADKFAFWRNLCKSKHGRNLRVSVGNFSGDAITSGYASSEENIEMSDEI